MHPDGRLKLGDLGLGRYLDHSSVLAFSQVGTPLYMSPEVLRGGGHDFASDIWSLGCLLYELAMLQTPFQSKGLTMDKLFQKIINGSFDPVDSTLYESRMQKLVADMLEVDMKSRPNIDKVSSAALLARTSSSVASSGGSVLNYDEGGGGEDEEEDEESESEYESETSSFGVSCSSSTGNGDQYNFRSQSAQPPSLEEKKEEDSSEDIHSI